MSRSLLIVIVLLSASACRTGDSLGAADLALYQETANDLSAELQAYRGAAAAMGSATDCVAALDLHVNRARRDVGTMGPLAGRVGDQVMGMPDEMRCAMGLVSREVERHAALGCASPDMAQNRAEAEQYCDAMDEYVDHLRMRGAQAAGMMGSGGMMGPGGMMGHDGGGFPMMDGGTMPWDHRLAGCGADGG